MLGGNRTISVSVGNTVSVGTGQVVRAGGQLSSTLSHPNGTGAAAAIVDLSVCNEVRVGVSGGSFLVLALLDSAAGFDSVVGKVAGSEVVWTLTDFGGVDLTDIMRVQLTMRDDITLLAPFRAI